MNRLALIDADPIAYIVGWNFHEHTTTLAIPDVFRAVDELLKGIFASVDGTHRLIALACEDKCFRYDIAKYKPYKGNRNKEPDQWLKFWKPIITKYLVDEYGAVKINSLEADDIIAYMAAEINNDEWTTFICSTDKDLQQISAYHHNPVKGGLKWVSQIEAEYNFAYQMLVGDTVDNVAGLPGVGDVKARAKLNNATEERSYMDIAKAEYLKYFGDYYGEIIFQEVLDVLGLMVHSHRLFPVYKPLLEELGSSVLPIVARSSGLALPGQTV